MPTRTELLGDGTVSREKTLSVAGRFEPLPASLTRACRVVGVLGASIEIPMLAMCVAWEDLVLGGSVALACIGVEHARDRS